ncbi:MAG: hypothetical protein ACOY45_07910 [Pseudomonadota bacterium]
MAKAWAARCTGCRAAIRGARYYWRQGDGIWSDRYRRLARGPGSAGYCEGASGCLSRYRWETAPGGTDGGCGDAEPTALLVVHYLVGAIRIEPCEAMEEAVDTLAEPMRSNVVRGIEEARAQTARF